MTDEQSDAGFPYEGEEAESAVAGVSALNEPRNSDYQTATLPTAYWEQLIYLAQQHAGWAAIEGESDVASADMGIADELGAQIDIEEN